ncbi:MULTISPECIES: hypothetical protein [unclassified Streptomyces]
MPNVDIQYHPDQACALGYHDLTSKFLPLAKVFAGKRAPTCS